MTGLGIASLLAFALPVLAAETPPTIPPMQVQFIPSQSATRYSVPASGGNLSYQWTLTPPANDPTCNNHGVLTGTGSSFVWAHGDSDNCNHNVEGPLGHRGTVSVVVSDGHWSCRASYTGTQGPNGRLTAVAEFAPCTALAATVAPVAAAARAPVERHGFPWGAMVALLALLCLGLWWVLRVLEKMRRCPPQKVAADKAACAAAAAADGPQLQKLQARGQQLKGTADAYNRSVLELNGQVESLQSDISDYVTDEVDYANSLIGVTVGSATLTAHYSALFKQAMELQDRVNELSDQEKSLGDDASSFQQDEQQYAADVGSFIAGCNAFLKTLQCAACPQVAKMVATASALPVQWQLDALPPLPVIPFPPPPPPGPDQPKPPAPGDQADGTRDKSDQKKRRSRCKVTAQAKLEPLQLYLAILGSEAVGGQQGYDVSIYTRYLPLVAYGRKQQTVEATVTWENGGVETHEGDWALGYPARGVEYAWTLDSVRVTDPKAKNVQPKVLLRGRGDLEGAKSVKGSLVLLEPDFQSCYIEWFEWSDIGHFDGKLADLEISLTCTATWQGESVTKHVKVVAKGTRWGDPGQQVDCYHMTADLPPVPDPQFVDKHNGPEGTGEYAHCLLLPTWVPPQLTFSGTTDIQVRGGQPVVLGLSCSGSSTLRFKATCSCDDCDGSETEVTDLYPPLSFAAGEWADWIYTGTMYDAPTDEAVKLDISGWDGTQQTVPLTIHVTPYGDLVDFWWQSDRLLDKLAEAGVLDGQSRQAIAQCTPRDPDLWRYVDCGLKALKMTLKSYRGVLNVGERLQGIAKDPIYAFEISKTLPPGFAGIPSDAFAKLHPLKRVVEPLVGSARLGDLLQESTGPDYFYWGGSQATFDEAFHAYFQNVTRPNVQSPWTPPDAATVDRLCENVRFHRLQQAAAVRCNEIIKVLAAAEEGRTYTPKIALVGTPRLTLQHPQGYPPELHFSWCERTKLLGDDGQPLVQRFRITMQVELSSEARQLTVRQTGQFVNFTMELDEAQRRLVNGQLAEWQVPQAAQYNAPRPQPEPYGPDRPVQSLLSLKSSELALQSWKHWAIDTAWRRASGSAAWSAGIYLITDGFKQMIDGARKEGMMGALKGFGSGILGAGAAAATSFLTQGVLDFAQRCADLGVRALERLEAQYVAAFGRSFAQGLAKGAAEREAMILAGRIPLVAGRWALKGVVPVVGWAVLLYDVAKIADDLSKSLGEIIFDPESDEVHAWRDPLYSIAQQDLGNGTFMIQRGIQVRTTGIVNQELSAPAYGTIYHSMLGPRATRWIFPGGTTLEIADEVIGPETEGLPLSKFWVPLLPHLPTDGLLIDNADEPYRAARDQNYFVDFYYRRQRIRDQQAGRYEEPRPQRPRTEKERERDYASALQMWGQWRDTCATQWIKVEHPSHGPGSPPVTLLWWRDFMGREGQVTELPDGHVREGRFDLQYLLQQIEGK